MKPRRLTLSAVLRAPNDHLALSYPVINKNSTANSLPVHQRRVSIRVHIVHYIRNIIKITNILTNNKQTTFPINCLLFVLQVMVLEPGSVSHGNVPSSVCVFDHPTLSNVSY